MARTLTRITPDFYTYPPRPIDRVETGGDRVEVVWPDTVSLRLHALWLWENRPGEAIDEATREGTLDPGDLPDPSVMTAARPGPTGDLVVEWSSAAASSFDSGWLRHVAEGRHLAGAALPTPSSWTAETMPQPPTFDGPAALVDDRVLREWLEALVRYGIARLEGLPCDQEVVPALGRRIGALRDTNFGVTWPVRVDVDPVSTANTALPLPPHTDLPTRETPPGFQLLHCLVNTCADGLSHMTDGYAIAAHLAENDPGVYEALTTLRWVFFNRSPDHDHRWSGPIIDAGGPGQPLTLRAFHPVRAFPDMDEDDVARAYAALRRFGEVAGSVEFQMRYAFRPGDLVAFDNRRILHGRGSIDADGGVRELHGTYIDHDEVFSRLRVLSRQLESHSQGEP